MNDRLKQITIIVTGIITLSSFTRAAEAQQSPTSLPTNLGNDSIRESDILVDPNNSSQQFFEQGKEQLYLLPKDSGENILKIDKTTKVDGVKYDDLQPKLPNRKSPNHQ